jgi:arylformamidase
MLLLDRGLMIEKPTVRFVDLTHPIWQNMPVWPGDPAPEFSEKASVEKNGYAVHTMKLSNHTGTHLDAPSHVIRGGMTLDQIPLDTLIGRAVILDFTDRGKKDVLAAHDFERHRGRLQAGARVLVKTGWDRHFNTPSFYKDFPCLTPDAAEYLVSRKIRLLGMDMPSPSPTDDHDQVIHKAFLGAGIILLEALRNLTLLGGDECELIALPPLFSRLSGAPCRVVAVESD